MSTSPTHFDLVSDWRIHAPVEQVWAALTDPTSWPRWWPYVRSVHTLHEGNANGVGALRTVALRPHLIWGKGDPHLVPRVLARAKAGRLKRVGDGTNKVDITHVEDAADAHLLALEHIEAAAGKAYFISSEAVLLWEWINALLARMGLPPVTRSVPRGLAFKIGATFEFLYGLFGIASEPPMTRFVAENLATSHWFDISRARTDLGYEPKRSGPKALDDYVKTEATHAAH